MPQFVFGNNVKTSLAGPVSTTATTITLSSVANVPTIPSGYVWPITLNDAATQTVFEIVYATANLGSGQFQVLRGQEGTTAQAWLANDLVLGCVTAAALNGFLNSSSLGNFVQLSPSARQTGFVNVSGNITAGGSGVFGGGVSVGGGVSNATTGAFSSDVSALDFIATRAYANTGFASLPLRFNGSGGQIGAGPSSGLSYNGITGSAFAIGSVATGKGLVLDTLGNLSTYGALYTGGAVVAGGDVDGTAGTFSVQVTSPFIAQNGTQVLSTLTSSDGSVALSRSGPSFNLSVSSSPIILRAYNQSGGSLPSPKLVSGSTYCPGGSVVVNLTGAAVFSGAGTYTVLTAVAYPAPASTSPAYPENLSGSQFQLFQANASTCNWYAIGY